MPRCSFAPGISSQPGDPMERPTKRSSYLNHHLLLLILATFISSSLAKLSLANSTADQLALISFKSSISDPSGALASWENATFHYCQWWGVTCGNQHPERVTALILTALNLTGPISPHIANLTFLRKLRLDDNNFQGSIPQELGKLSRLRYLNFSFNYLDGEIPVNLTRCSELQSIHLVVNELVGRIPSEISLLSKLRVLTLSKNNISGSIPPSIGNLSSLSSLLILENGLEGSIPESMGRLSNLILLQLSENKLSGKIPSTLYNLSSLKSLSLSRNHLVGELPPNLFNTLPNLEQLLLFENQLEGSIPASLSNSSNLEDLEISSNNFSGTIPPNLGTLQYFYWVELSYNQLEARDNSDWDFLTSLTNCSFLEHLGIEYNRLGGNLPSSVAHLSSNLQHLAMGYNEISGVIPDEIGNLVNLSILTLNDNILTGSIPATIGKLQQLSVMSLAGNLLSGRIPDSIGNLTQLNHLNLQGNNLNGGIPDSLGNCQSLQELDLSRNRLTGAIPKEILSLPSLATHLDLSHNFLTGSLPLEVGKLTNLNELSISNNRLSGGIPSTLSSCQSLEYLYMQENSFSGPIPQSLSSLKGLQQLDLSLNMLSGEIPKYLATFGGLLYLNLSFNNFEGEIPNGGIFRNRSAVSLLGNKKLCAGPCHSQSSKKKNKHLLFKLIIPLLSAATLTVLLVIYVTRHQIKKLKKQSSFASINEQFIRVSYAELLKATDGFSPSNLIGAGSVGSVYKGTIALDKSIVAVKVLNLQKRGASKSFMAECEVLRHIRHRNLVKILTSCSTVDFNGSDFKALVLEYMPNGSLENWLHPVASMQTNSTGLSFIQRLNIAIDVASALEYLHHHGQTPIVHCDLKPSNILLDTDMCAHVGDFGLARFLEKEAITTDAQQTISTGISGTIGYIAPEYGISGEASTQGDVYSYGIVLLELFTGQRPTDEMFKDGLSLHSNVEMAFPNHLKDVVDPSMCLFEDAQEAQANRQNRYDTNETMLEVKCLVTIIGIALSCSRPDPTSRMVMECIARDMHSARDALLRPRTQEVR